MSRSGSRFGGGGRAIGALLVLNGRVEDHVGGLLHCVAYGVPVEHRVALCRAEEWRSSARRLMAAFGGGRRGDRMRELMVSALRERSGARETRAAGGDECALAHKTLAALEILRCVRDGVGSVFVAEEATATKWSAWDSTDS